MQNVARLSRKVRGHRHKMCACQQKHNVDEYFSWQANIHIWLESEVEMDTRVSSHALTANEVRLLREVIVYAQKTHRNAHTAKQNIFFPFADEECCAPATKSTMHVSAVPELFSWRNGTFSKCVRLLLWTTMNPQKLLHLPTKNRMAPPHTQKVRAFHEH